MVILLKKKLKSCLSESFLIFANLPSSLSGPDKPVVYVAGDESGDFNLNGKDDHVQIEQAPEHAGGVSSEETKIEIQKYNGFAKDDIEIQSSGPAEHYILFQISEEEAKKEVRWQMNQGDYTPDDILEKSKIKQNFSLYIPVHLVKGNYSATLTYIAVVNEECKDIVQNHVENEIRNNKGIKIRELKYPAKKEIFLQRFEELAVATNFDRLLQPELVSGLENFCEELDFLEDDIRCYLKESIGRFDHASLHKNRLDAESKINERIKKRIKSTICNGLEGHSQENKQLTVNINVKDVKRLYLPFWFFIYSYDNKDYLLVVDGKNCKRIFYKNKPVDQEKLRKKQELYIKYFAPIILLIITVFSIYILNNDFVISNFFTILILVIFLTALAFIAANSKIKEMINKSIKNREDSHERKD